MCYYTMKCIPILCKLQNYSIGGGVLDMVHAQCHTYFKEGLETFFFQGQRDECIYHKLVMQKIGNFLLPALRRKKIQKGLTNCQAQQQKKESHLSACIFSTPKTKTLGTKSHVSLIGAKHIWENHPPPSYQLFNCTIGNMSNGVPSSKIQQYSYGTFLTH